MSASVGFAAFSRLGGTEQSDPLRSYSLDTVAVSTVVVSDYPAEADTDSAERPRTIHPADGTYRVSSGSKQTVSTASVACSFPLVVSYRYTSP
ncbi:hypothetical protein D8S78_12780 [Natrialba swarupiae]|nr:hypothetical protein [Natrialba swarupiae]